jgi:hypothetical protein
MSSASNGEVGSDHQITDTGDSIESDAQELVKLHGEEADIVAAHLADRLFTQGDDAGGARWLEVFRRIAAAHRGRIRKTGGG